MLLLKPISFTESQREPRIPPQLGSLPMGSKVFQTCETTELMPMARGSRALPGIVAPLTGSTTAVGFRLYTVQLAKLAAVSELQAAPATFEKRTRPRRIAADGTGRSIVTELFQRKP